MSFSFLMYAFGSEIRFSSTSVTVVSLENTILSIPQIHRLIRYWLRRAIN